MATLDPNSTVAGQTEKLLGKDSGLQQAAETRGLQQANSRGLLNSSLAAEASQKATYDSILPIAQQDAQTSAQFDLSDKTFGQQTQLSDQSFKQQQSLNKDQFGFNTQLSAQGSKQDLLAQAQGAEQRSKLSGQEFGQTTQLNAQQIAAQREQLLTQIQSQSNISRQEAEQQLNQLQADYQGRTGLQTLAGQQNLTEIDARAKNDLQLQTLAAQTQKDLAAFNQAGSVALANLDSQNRVLLQTSQSAAQRYGDLMTQIGAIMQNPQLKTADKITASNTLIAYTQQAFDLQNELLKAAGLTPSTSDIPFVGTSPTGAVSVPGVTPTSATTIPAPVPPNMGGKTPIYGAYGQVIGYR